MKAIGLKQVIVIALIFSISVFAFGKEESNIDRTSLSIDIRNIHTWRGGLTTNTFNVQPAASFTHENFTTGAWSCFAQDGSYAELDLYVSYTIKHFSLTVYDYYCPDMTVNTNDFFEVNNTTTKHTIDVVFGFSGTENFPIRLMSSTLVYGDDKKDESNKNAYSTYLEAGYPVKLNDFMFDFFMGVTPYNSLYADKLSVVNSGVTISYPVRLFKNYMMPVYTSLVANPTDQRGYFLMGFSLSL